MLLRALVQCARSPPLGQSPGPQLRSRPTFWPKARGTQEHGRRVVAWRDRCCALAPVAVGVCGQHHLACGCGRGRTTTHGPWRAWVRARARAAHAHGRGAYEYKVPLLTASQGCPHNPQGAQGGWLARQRLPNSPKPACWGPCLACCQAAPHTITPGQQDAPCPACASAWRSCCRASTSQPSTILQVCCVCVVVGGGRGSNPYRLYIGIPLEHYEGASRAGLNPGNPTLQGSPSSRRSWLCCCCLGWAVGAHTVPPDGPLRPDPSPSRHHLMWESICR